MLQLSYLSMHLEDLLLPVIAFGLLALLLSLGWVVRVYLRRLPNRRGERLGWVDAWVSAKVSVLLTPWLLLCCLSTVHFLEPDWLDLMPHGEASLGGTLFLATFVGGLAIFGRRPLDSTQADRLIEVEGAVLGVSALLALAFGLLISIALGPSFGLFTLAAIFGLGVLACCFRGVPRVASAQG